MVSSSLLLPAHGGFHRDLQKKENAQAVVFILSSPSQICSRSSFFPLVFCSFLLRVADLAAEEGVLGAGAAGAAVRWGGAAAGPGED